MKRLELIDSGRFFATIIVVFFHYIFNGIVNGKISSISHIPEIIESTKYGYLGVELFLRLVVMLFFYSAKNRTASEFIISRAVRLYPSYWFGILFTSFFAIYWGGDLMTVEPKQILANFTMFQNYFGFSNVDGVYWTLDYELSFYLAVLTILILN